mmetsp:Transcript_33609/g.34232  ORF Transcript_33609/g.34232 Transcript_33609/m.34232 type:complete len:154 (+) Transcript_33609:195-656(+)
MMDMDNEKNVGESIDLLSTPVSKSNTNQSWEELVPKCSPIMSRNERLSFNEEIDCEDQCSICLLSLNILGRSTVQTRCKHNFHSDCLFQSKLENKFECPMCRSRLTPPKQTDIVASIPVNEQNPSQPQDMRAVIAMNAKRNRSIMRNAQRKGY